MKKIFLFILLGLVLAASYFIYMVDEDLGLATQTVVDSISTITTSTNTQPSVPIKQNTRDELLKKMHLTFEDNFNDFSQYKDKNGRTTCEAGGTGTWQTVMYFCSRTIPTNKESEYYLDQIFLDYLKNDLKLNPTTETPFIIKNGILSIEAKPIDPVISKVVGEWAGHTSGLITTQFSFSQKYGYFEMRARLPAGKGLWPAFWLLPVDKTWPPEIDILETFGGKNVVNNQGGSNLIHYASHSNIKDKSCSEWFDIGIDVTKDFHTYGVDWEPTGISYYFDGKMYAKCLPNPEANQPFYILLNLAVGGKGAWPGEPDSSNKWPAYFEIDYVRAYQKNN